MTDHFFNCDWGTTRFRLRLVHVSSETVVSARSSDQGAVKLSAEATPEHRGSLFRSVLEQHLNEIAATVDADLQGAPVLVSGMASSSIGWHELPYATLPFSLDGSNLRWQRVASSVANTASPVILCSGLRSDRDVMRGEEVELLGLGTLLPKLLHGQALVVMPGTHSKHVSIVEGRIVDFHTHMTGELFDLLRSQSSLRHPQRDLSQSTEHVGFSAEQRVTFGEGVAMAQQTSLTSALFQVRVRQVLQGSDPGTSAALLSGLLIGSEIAALSAEGPKDSTVVLCAAAPLSEAYGVAFDELGLSDRVAIVAPADVERLSALGQLVLMRLNGRHQPLVPSL